jgi:hypothetical protein
VTVQDEEKVTVVQAATNEAKPAAAIEEVQTVNATVGKCRLKGQHQEIFENCLILRDFVKRDRFHLCTNTHVVRVYAEHTVQTLNLILPRMRCIPQMHFRIGGKAKLRLLP